MDVLIDIHSVMRWVVLAAVLGGGVLGIERGIRRAEWNALPYSVATILLDVQVTIGIILWAANRGWDQGFFIAVIHPIVMLAGLAVAHVALARARAQNHHSSHMTAGVGMLVALVLLVAGVPWERL